MEEQNLVRLIISGSFVYCHSDGSRSEKRQLKGSALKNPKTGMIIGEMSDSSGKSIIQGVELENCLLFTKTYNLHKGILLVFRKNILEMLEKAEFPKQKWVLSQCAEKNAWKYAKFFHEMWDFEYALKKVKKNIYEGEWSDYDFEDSSCGMVQLKISSTKVNGCLKQFVPRLSFCGENGIIREKVSVFKAGIKELKKAEFEAYPD